MSGASVSDVNDRLSALELRVQQQEDELTVMKAALADVLRRLAASEVSAASSTKKQHGGKGNVCLCPSCRGPCVRVRPTRVSLAGGRVSSANKGSPRLGGEGLGQV